MSYGVMAGLQYGPYGGYMRARFRNAITGIPGYSYEVFSSGTLPGDSKFWGTGQIEIYALSVTCGMLLSVREWLQVCIGAGYAERCAVTQDIDKEWALISDWGDYGIAVDAGFLFSWRCLAVSAGVTTIKFNTAAFTCGIGVRL